MKACDLIVDVVVAANAKKWSVADVQEWANEVVLPEPVVKALYGLSGEELADMAEDPDLVDEFKLISLHAKRLKNALAKLTFQ